MDFLNRVAVVTGGTGAVGRVRVRGLAGGLRAGGRPRHAHRAGAALPANGMGAGSTRVARTDRSPRRVQNNDVHPG